MLDASSDRPDETPDAVDMGDNTPAVDLGATYGIDVTDATADAVDLGDFASETRAQIADAVGELQELPTIQHDVWDTLQPGDRLVALQEVENRLADIQQRPSVSVMEDPTMG